MEEKYNNQYTRYGDKYIKGSTGVCKMCKIEYTKNISWQVFCSSHCKGAWRRRNILKSETWDNYAEKRTTAAETKKMSGRKRCSACHKVKEFSEYYTDKRRTYSFDGYKSRCKECCKVYQYERVKKEKRTYNNICEYCKKEYQSQRIKKYCSKECGNEIHKKTARYKYHNDIEYREKCLLDSRNRHIQDRSKMLARKHKRKAKLKQQHDGTVDAKALRLIMSERQSCIYCGIKLKDEHKEIDHMNAICLGGAHSVNNLIVCCHKCNQLKKGKPFDLWLDYVPENRRQVVQKVYERKQGRIIEQEPFNFKYSS